MSKIIYCYASYRNGNESVTGETNGGKRELRFFFNNQPSTENDKKIFDNMKKKIKLKKDLKWHERYDLENVIEKFGFWGEFPTDEYLLINYEYWTDNQFVDLLYLRNDGKVIPCEIKIGGHSKDAHGQLIRYMSSLAKTKIDKQWIINTLNSYLKKIATRIHKNKVESGNINNILRTNTIISSIRDDFNKFISNNNIKSYNFLHKSGLIFDEDFTTQLKSAVKYLNNQCGFCIKFFILTTYVQNNFDLEKEEDFLFKLIIDEYDGK